MISALAEFDSHTAAGIVARAALAVEDEANPAALATLPGEDRVRDRLFAEVRASLELAPNDWSPMAMSRIGDALDQELDALSPVENEQRVLDELGKRGELPADLYRIVIDEGMRNIYAKHWLAEVDRIHKTIKKADREESLGLENPVEPSLVKLFARHYAGGNPYHDYTHLVVTQPGDNRQLYVAAAWRLYTFSVPHVEGASLLDMLKRFCAVYGVKFKVDGIEHEAFTLTLNIPGEEMSFKVEVGAQTMTDSKGRRVPKPLPALSLSFFTERGADRATGAARSAYMVTCINSDKYKAALVEHGW